MAKKNIFYAQSGGVTAVINATASGVITAARSYPHKFGAVFAGKNGLLGAIHENLIDTSYMSAKEIVALKSTPAGAFGSCRVKLASGDQALTTYRRIFAVFEAHDIGYFFYNGGGDSQDTTYKIAKMSQEFNYPLTCIGLPKTIDNDLPLTDNCPGFGSVAKYIAVSIREAGLDVMSMADTSTKIFVMEVMGRHTGWIAAAAGLAAEYEEQAPHIILFPEIPFEPNKFLERVAECVNKYGYCAIVVSEGVRDTSGKFLQAANNKDAFGHTQLGGVAPYIAQLISTNLGYKHHWAVCDYLQRAARHIASKIDVEQAFALGSAAVDYAMQGLSDVMLIIERLSNSPYSWQIANVALDNVANQEKALPSTFITSNGMHITQAAREYLLPLIQGEDYPEYCNGLPNYFRLTPNTLVNKKLPAYTNAI